MPLRSLRWSFRQSAVLLAAVLLATLRSQAQNFTVLHGFIGGSDAAEPFVGLVMDTAENLYGTAVFGGSGAGTVFELSLAVPFSSFSATLDTSAGPPPEFNLKAAFTQGAGGQAINTPTQALTLQVGTYQVTIPAGSFQQTKKGTFVYDGTING